jgi:hypothetical protein
MVVGPGSEHPSGRIYAVEDDREIAVLPAEWATEATTWSRSNFTKQDAAEPGDPDWKIPVNSRHNWLLHKAGQLRYIGLRGAALEAALLTLNAERCDPPKDESEVRRMARDFDKKKDDSGAGPFFDSDNAGALAVPLSEVSTDPPPPMHLNRLSADGG